MTSENQKSLIIDEYKQDIYRELVNSILLKDVLIDNIEKQIVVISTANPEIKTITSLPDDTFSVGSYVLFEGEYWIIISSDCDDDIYSKGEMRICKNTLKFQNASGDIFSYKYFVNSATPSLDENTSLINSDTVRKIVIPFNSVTAQFYSGKRFLGTSFNGIPQCWKITDLDSESKPGLLIIALEKDEYKEASDNKVLGIADYYIPTEPDGDEEIATCKISYLGLPQIKIGGSAKKFTAIFRDGSGNVLTNITPVWDIDLPQGLENYFNCTSNGNFISISAINKIVLQGKKVTVNLSGSTGNYSASVEAEVVSAI